MSGKKNSKRSIVIQNETFTSKKSLEDKCRSIRDRHVCGDKVADAEDYNFLMELFHHHRSIYAKLPCSNPDILINYATYGTKGFYFSHEGSVQSISFKTAIDNAFALNEDCDSDTLYDFRTAARQAIQNQITSYRNALKSQDKVFCELTGVELKPNDLHIDHVPPKEFDTLLFEWVKDNSIPIERTGIEKTAYGATKFVNKRLAKGWSEFHAENAELRALSKAAHATVPKPNNDWRGLLMSQKYKDK